MVIECLEIRLDLSRKIYFDMTKLESENLIFLENRDIIFIQRLREKSKSRCSTTASALVFQTRYGGAAPLTGSMSS